VLYGDPLASAAMWEAGPDLVVPKSIGSPYFVNEFPLAVLRSFVGAIGWANLSMPEWLYRVFAAIAVLGTVGCVWRWVVRPHDRRLLIVIGSMLPLAVVLVIHLNLTYSQPQGRYLFPALTATALLIALGLEALPRWSPRWTLALTVGLGVLNVWVLSTTVVPSYGARPDEVEEAAVTNLPVATTMGVSPKGRRGVAPRELLRYYRFRLPTPPPEAGKTAGPLRPGIEYGQGFVAEQDDLTKVELEFASYALFLNRGTMEMHLRSTLTDATDIASTSIPLLALNTRSFVGPSFAPIPNSRGKTFYVVFEIPTGHPPITVWLRDGAAREDERFFVAGQARSEGASLRAEYAPAASAP
jgi:hypothetical protein